LVVDQAVVELRLMRAVGRTRAEMRPGPAEKEAA
jgi:hypothetical protein